MSVEECEDLFGLNYNRIKDFNGKEFSIALPLASNLLMSYYWARKYNGDLIIFCDGREGSGKSTLARQMAKLLDPNFTEKNIIYTFADLKNRYYNGVKWEVIVYDESQEGVDRLSFLDRENKDFNAFMRQSRQANKVLIMCGPSIYDISSYVAQHRVNFLIHCYKRDNIHPGYFLFFNEDLIHRLFVHDKKERDYRQTANFSNTFSNSQVCDMEIYNAKKKEAFQKFAPKEGASPVEPSLTPEEVIRNWRISRVVDWPQMKLKSKNLRVKDLCTVLDISRPTLYKWAEKNGVVIDNIAMRGNTDNSEDNDSEPPPVFVETMDLVDTIRDPVVEEYVEDVPPEDSDLVGYVE